MDVGAAASVRANKVELEHTTPASVDAWFVDLCYEIIVKVAKNSKLLRSVVNKAISKLLLHGRATKD